MPLNALGNYIRDCRHDLGLTREQLAERVGGNCRECDISRLERGRSELPRLPMLVSLAAALEIPLGDLVVASGWFTEDDMVNRPISDDGDRLEMLLGEIETELESIRELEHQVQIRSDQLRLMIRDMEAVNQISETMPWFSLDRRPLSARLSRPS